MKKFNVKTVESLHQKSIENIATFWEVVLNDIGMRWFEPYTQIIDQSAGIEWTRWFLNGKTNIIYNCLDRHQTPQKKNDVAILWEGDDGERRTLTFKDFFEKVGQTANALKALEVREGDTVGILMPMVPEVAIQLFACFKIGAVAIPIFSGFGVEAVKTRLEDAKVKVLFTADVVYRRGKAIPVKSTADEATINLKSLRKRVVFRRGDGNCSFDPKKDLWWHDYVLSFPSECETASLPSESLALILYTSGTTGRPKGTVHTHAGCLAQIAKEHRYAFNVDEKTRFFWFTDIGWMMGPWEMIGVSFFGGTFLLFEGTPDYPTPSRIWELIERYQITTLGISPTAIRLLKKFGEEYVRPFSLSSLKILGSTGETWDPESYLWYFEWVGKKRCPIINISGGTEIIGCLLSPLPIQPLKPCSLGGPGLGVDADVFDEDGNSIREGIGHLVCKQPLPSMTKGFLNAQERYLETYFSKWKGIWYHGDWAKVDKDGYWFLFGRSDDTIKIAGKRIGPSEYESILLEHPKIAESAAIGVPDSLKGESCVCFVVLKPNIANDENLKNDLLKMMVNAVGKAMSPKCIFIASALPKTRSAKILRGLIRKIYLNETNLDLSSVENIDAVKAIESAIKSQ